MQGRVHGNHKIKNLIQKQAEVFDFQPQPVITYQLSEEERQAVIDRYGHPTAPINKHISKWYANDPDNKKKCKLCDEPHYAADLCRNHYQKKRRLRGLK